MQKSLGLVSPMVTGFAPGTLSERVAPAQSRKADQPRRSGEGNSIYVGNLPFSVTGQDLERIFGKYGKVHSATVVTHRDSKKSRGFGFVEMPPTALHGAIAALDGSSVAGRQLKVRSARPGSRPPLT